MKNTTKEITNKIKENKWFIFTVLLSAVFGMILGGVTLPYFFYSNIESKEVANWSSVLAAVGTLGTLIFLIRESFRTKKEQKQIRKEQRVYQEKQDKLWDEQNKLIAFQRYTGHRESFEKLLSNIEKAHELNFYDSEKLYRNLFPNNGFSQCDFKIETKNPKNPKKPNDLNDILQALNYIEEKLSIMDRFNKYERQNKICDIVFDIFRLRSMLYFDFEKKEEIGDISLEFKGKHFVLNIFSPSESLNIIRDVISKLLIFSGNGSLPPSLNNINNSWNRSALLSAMIPTSPKHYSLSIESVTSNREISFLCEWFLFMDNHISDYVHTNEKYKYNDVAQLLLSKRDVEKIISESVRLKAKVGECLEVLGKIENDDNKFKHAKRIKERYSDLI
ncbi:hypothetical protein [Salinivibrio sp. KP-1]|uniref:hypothetical protein n=1 Tax=Salinivibrio sp. KP-1 TaxID=1406902 RepID=UPI000614830B|nr:hypothetical protein [Salinivibrio sp. KP-1]KKA45125.1 hypothetical protein WN56_06840 [Salinivibrio sp. KP-1]